MEMWTYNDLTNWINQGCDPDVGLTVFGLVYAKSNLTELPPAISLLANLEFLDLSYNKLTHIPPYIGLLTKLKEVNLIGNKLTDLPPEMGNLVNLIYLDLINNPFTDLPQEVLELINELYYNLNIPYTDYINLRKANTKKVIEFYRSQQSLLKIREPVLEFDI